MPRHRQALSVTGYIMTTFERLIVFLLLGLSSCGQRSSDNEIHPTPVELNEQAMKLVPFIENPDSSKKAINLLDRATTIDSTYFLGYVNKLMFYYQLRLFDKALLANNRLIQLRPFAHDLYLRSGFLYTHLGDTSMAKAYFTKGLTICNSVLDTMTRTNRDYVLLMTNRAIALIMLDDSAKANKNLKTLYDIQLGDPNFDNIDKEYILSLMNKSRKELIGLISEADKYSR